MGASNLQLRTTACPSPMPFSSHSLLAASGHISLLLGLLFCIYLCIPVFTHRNGAGGAPSVRLGIIPLGWQWCTASPGRTPRMGSCGPLPSGAVVGTPQRAQHPAAEVRSARAELELRCWSHWNVPQMLLEGILRKRIWGLCKGLTLPWGTSGGKEASSSTNIFQGHLPSTGTGWTALRLTGSHIFWHSVSSLHPSLWRVCTHQESISDCVEWGRREGRALVYVLCNIQPLMTHHAQLQVCKTLIQYLRNTQRCF